MCLLLPSHRNEAYPGHTSHPVCIWCSNCKHDCCERCTVCMESPIQRVCFVVPKTFLPVVKLGKSSLWLALFNKRRFQPINTIDSDVPSLAVSRPPDFYQCQSTKVRLPLSRQTAGNKYREKLSDTRTIQVHLFLHKCGPAYIQYTANIEFQLKWRQRTSDLCYFGLSENTIISAIFGVIRIIIIIDIICTDIYALFPVIAALYMY